MSKQSELSCWNIIDCNWESSCCSRGNTEKACWEYVETEAECLFHICADCLVYLAKHKNSILSDKEFCSILAQRKARGIRQHECHLAHALR